MNFPYEDQTQSRTILANRTSWDSVTLHLTDFTHSGRICCWHNCQGGLIFVSKTAAVLLAFLSLMLFPTTSKAQLLPSGNVYAGVGYADNVDVVNRLTFRGWEGSVEMLPFHRFSYLGLVLDGSGFYRTGVHQY